MQRRSVLLALLPLPAGTAWALYDPKPDPALAGVQGEWKGSLTYRDYRQPDRLVTLPTRLFVALGAPDELVLHFIFDDGPGKTVFSYDRIRFDFAAGQVSWASGQADQPARVHRIVSTSGEGATRQISFERPDGDNKARFTLDLSPKALRLIKEEVVPSGSASFRNRYEFVRPGA